MPTERRSSHPINCVDWNQATAFCAWGGGRLPTEEEWYAEASNRSRRQHPWGTEEVSCDYAIWRERSRTNGCGKNSTWPVCSKPRGNSASGLCDMSGNVSEWTSTTYGSGGRVLRGGSWSDGNPDFLRAGNRYWYAPSHRSSGDGRKRRQLNHKRRCQVLFNRGTLLWRWK